MTFPMRITHFDRLTVDDRDYRLIDAADETAQFESVDGVKSKLVLSPEKLTELLRSPNATFERGYYLIKRTAAREASNVDVIGDLPENKRSVVLWRLAYCQAFIQLEKSGELKRTDSSIKQSMPKLNGIVSQQELTNQFKWKPSRAGQERKIKTPPCVKTLRNWLKTYEIADRSPISLIPKHHCSGNYKDRFCLESRQLMGRAFEAFLTKKRKNKSLIHKLCRRIFDDANQNRKARGVNELAVPSKRTVERALSKFDPYFTTVHRYGSSQANRDFVLWENGIDVSYPMERVEIDEWKVDLISILAERGALDGLTPQELAHVERGRRWLYLAIDCATRCVLSMRLAREPNSVDAIATLADITRDKTDIARAAGCSGDWSEYGGLVTVATDLGAAFVDHDFRTAILDVAGTHETPPGGIPKLRARVERIFGTFGTMLMPHLVGRTFSNTKERGDYPSSDMAAISDDALMQMLVLFVVDVYHNQPHKGLNGETPRNCWKRLTAKKGKAPELDERTRRRAFGMPLNRKVSGKGVTVYNIDYTCAALRHFHLHSHETHVDIKVDPRDLGWIMVRIERTWYVATALQKCFAGVCLEDWRAAARALNLKHRTEAAIHERTVAEALRQIEKINAQEQDRFGMYLRRLTPHALQRAEEDNFLGLSIEPDNPDGFELPPEEDLFGSIIPLPNDAEPPELAENDNDDNPDGTGPTWEFDDD